MTDSYPIHLDLRGKDCLVVGGGRIAERRIAGLLAAGAAVTVVSPEWTPGIAAWAAEGTVAGKARGYRREDGEGMWLVFAATNDRKVNREVVRDAEERRQWVNAAYAAEEGNMSVPAVHRGRRLLVSVSTGGASPAAARRIAAEIGERYGAETEEVLALLHRIRLKARESVENGRMREALLTRLARMDWRQLVATGELERFGEALLAKLAAAAAAMQDMEEDAESLLDKIWPEGYPGIWMEGEQRI